MTAELLPVESRHGVYRAGAFVPVGATSATLRAVLSDADLATPGTILDVELSWLAGVEPRGGAAAIGWTPRPGLRGPSMTDPILGPGVVQRVPPGATRVEATLTARTPADVGLSIEWGA